MADNYLLEPNGYYLQVKAWHRSACPDNDCASALLAFLLFFHKHKQTMKEYARLTNEMLRKKGKPAIADETDWQFHTDEMLMAKLFYWKKDSIFKAIAYLRDDRGFIQTEAPAYLKALYKSGRTKWFCMNIGTIQQWINENYPLIERDASEIITMAPVERKYKKANEFLETAKRLFRFRQLLLNEPEAKPEKSQLNKIVSRLRAGKDEIDCAFATIGNFESPWHRGENPNGNEEGKVTYQQIRHIYYDGEKIEYFKMIAENQGWTREKVIARYEELLGIEYEHKTASESAAIQMTDEQRAEITTRYREIGSLLTELVITRQMKMPDILREFYNHSDKLKFTIIDLNDPVRLANEIIDCLGNQEIVTPERKERINNFTKTFLEKLRSGAI